MRHSQTAVIERGENYSGSFVSEPYELPWAGEARWFVQVIESDPDAKVRVITEISPDGLNWIPHEGVAPVDVGAPLVSWAVRDFGAWMRLRGEVSSGMARLRLYLVSKE